MAEPSRRPDIVPEAGPEPIRHLKREHGLTIEQRGLLEHDIGHQTFSLLRFGYTVLPIVVGIDKFFDLAADWDGYLAPQIPSAVGLAPHTFMMIVGVIEIIAGLGVAFKPKVFAPIVAIWLVGIIVNLVMTGQYYDIALRDLGLIFGAAALSRLSYAFASRN